MKLYLTEQQEKRLRELSHIETLAQQAVQLYLQGVFDAAGKKLAPAMLTTDDEGAFLDIPEKKPDAPEAE